MYQKNLQNKQNQRKEKYKPKQVINITISILILYIQQL